MTRSEWLDLMRPLREQGMTYQQIADELGCHVHKVADYISDPDGAKARARKRRRRASQPALRFPIERVLPVLQEWMDGHGQGAVAALEQDTGIDARQIYAMLNGERTFLTLGVVDTLLCGIGRTDLFHTEFADIYEEAA